MNIDEMAKAIEQELANYSEEVDEKLKKEIATVARECVDEIKANAHINQMGGTGEYLKNWTLKATKGKNYIRIIVHNKKTYRLTHLLENGHLLVKDGKVVGKTRPIPHIRPAEQSAERKLDGKVKVIVQG